MEGCTDQEMLSLCLPLDWTNMLLGMVGNFPLDLVLNDLQCIFWRHYLKVDLLCRTLIKALQYRKTIFDWQTLDSVFSDKIPCLNRTLI